MARVTKKPCLHLRIAGSQLQPISMSRIGQWVITKTQQEYSCIEGARMSSAPLEKEHKCSSRVIPASVTGKPITSICRPGQPEI
jgi:hypothetical protein